MGTTLTGTTPQDTYDSLIKVTDNGPLSGTAKYLSDGLGNDSVLALSTTAVGVGTATPSYKLDVDVSVNGDWATRIKNNSATGYGLYVEGSENSAQYLLGLNNGLAYKMVVTGEGNVGIGTSAPNYSLQVNSSTTTTRLQITNSTTGTGAANGLQIIQDGVNTTFSQKPNGFMSFETNNVERFAITANGLTFNGDTAAANALDDYEEGTWTPSIAFGGASVGVTLGAANAASYTKIGRQVTVNGYLILTSKGSSTGTARITGLPFTVANTNGTYSAATLRFSNITFANQFQGFANVNTTTIEFEETTILGVVSNITNADFANDSQVIFTVTYFV